MKIKEPSRKHIQKSRLKKLNKHYWLIQEQPRTQGRLAQLNKKNRRKPSEFVLMAERIEARYASR